MDPNSHDAQRASAWTFLWAVLGLLGGIVGYLVVKDKDPRRARAVLFTGLGVSVAGLVLTVGGVALLSVTAVQTPSADEASSAASAEPSQQTGDSSSATLAPEEEAVRNATSRMPVGTQVGPCTVAPGTDCSGLDLTGLYLWGAQLKGANLDGAVLAGAVLSAAELDGATLRRADLSGSSLAGAWLKESDLTGADLTGAMLDGASVEAADFTGSTGLSTTVGVPLFVMPTTICPNGNAYSSGGDCPASWQAAATG